jgi:hypothetical protein
MSFGGVREAFRNAYPDKEVPNKQHADVIIMSIPRTHQHYFCAAGMSSGLATRMPSTTVWRWRLRQSTYVGVDQLLVSFLSHSTTLLTSRVLNGTPCTTGIQGHLPIRVASNTHNAHAFFLTNLRQNQAPESLILFIIQTINKIQENNFTDLYTRIC